MKHIAKKSLGQNFLTSENIAKEIVRFGNVARGDIVVEIGPGKGMLTKYLLDTGSSVVAVEKDTFLFYGLKEKFKEAVLSGQLELTHEDIMNFDTNMSLLQNSRYKIVANIPYNLTGAIFKKFLGAKNQPKSMVLMVQKEVGERILAKDGKESILSISIKAYGEPYIVKNVSKGHFLPKPKIDSVVINIENISKKRLKGVNEKHFFDILKRGFSHKRKVLINNLEVFGNKDFLSDILQQIGLEKNIRAERLNLENWVYLANQLPPVSRK